MTKTTPFVSNYNVPAIPFTLPDGRQVQANQLKNTFQRFKRELRDQDYNSLHTKTDLNSTIQSSPTEKMTRNQFYTPNLENTLDGEKANIVRLEKEEREALMQAVRHMQTQKRAHMQLKPHFEDPLNGSPSGETDRIIISPVNTGNQEHDEDAL